MRLMSVVELSIHGKTGDLSGAGINGISLFHVKFKKTSK
jgi:hypothetical protein